MASNHNGSGFYLQQQQQQKRQAGNELILGFHYNEVRKSLINGNLLSILPRQFRSSIRKW